MRPLPHSVVVPLTLHHSVWLTPCTWTSGWEHRGAHRRTESRDPATIRGGVEPQAMNWSLEPAGSQSETGPTHELASRWGAGSCFSGRNPMEGTIPRPTLQERARQPRWRIPAGTVALGATAFGVASFAAPASATDHRDT